MLSPTIFHRQLMLRPAATTAACRGMESPFLESTRTVGIWGKESPTFALHDSIGIDPKSLATIQAVAEVFCCFIACASRSDGGERFSGLGVGIERCEGRC
jgi:hypothetical protein